MYIDTHCHLSKEDYDNLEEVICDNKKSNVDKIIVSFCTKKTLDEAEDVVLLDENIYLTLGYHPEVADEFKESDLEYLVSLIKKLPRIVGIGEIGLDYYYTKENKEKQIELFKKQLKLAEEMNLPVVIHSREATEDTINILKEYNVKGVIHCFSGSIETAKIFVSMGFLLGIGGVVTFKNSNLYKVVEAVGIDNIVLETDSPYLTPVPYRGKKNSSKYIPYIAEKVAEVLDLELEKVEEITTSNAITLFDL